MLTNKEKYILEYHKSSNISDDNVSEEIIPLDINGELIKVFNSICKDKDITLSEYFTISIYEKLINIEKEKFVDEFENIIDIFDLYDIEKYIDSKKVYLVISPEGKNVVLMPVDKYEELVGEINEERD